MGAAHRYPLPPLRFSAGTPKVRRSHSVSKARAPTGPCAWLATVDSLVSLLGPLGRTGRTGQRTFLPSPRTRLLNGAHSGVRPSGGSSLGAPGEMGGLRQGAEGPLAPGASKRWEKVVTSGWKVKPNYSSSRAWAALLWEPGEPVPRLPHRDPLFYFSPYQQPHCSAARMTLCFQFNKNTIKNYIRNITSCRKCK